VALVVVKGQGYLELLDMPGVLEIPAVRLKSLQLAVRNSY